MFTLDPASALFSAAIEVVARSPGISVGDLHHRLTDRGEKVTLQHVYRLVNRLVDDRIFLKRKKALQINLLWLSNLELFAQEAKGRLLEVKELGSLADLPAGKRTQFSVRSVQEAQALWHHLLIQLNRIVPRDGERVLHKYYSHAWWLLKDEGDLSFYMRIAERGVRCLWLLGSDTYLDRRAQDRVKGIFAIALSDRPPFPKEGYNLNVYGEYVLECVFPAAIAGHFESLFKSVESAKEWNPAVLEDIFRLRAPITVSVTRSAAKAKELAAKIERLIPLQLKTRKRRN
ncbi:MAG: hypothetical protein KBC95_00495 [Candidatus Peribacteraceae bacterium]|nr:hypothetical protein [Candidatus Peribacteraceae bacterium]